MKYKHIGIVGFASIIIFVAAYVIGTILNLDTGYDHIRDSILAISNPKINNNYLTVIAFTAFFNAISIMGIGLIFLLSRNKKFSFWVGAFLLILSGIIGSGLSIFLPADQADSVPSNMGLYHFLFFSAFILSITLAILLLGFGLDGNKKFEKFKNSSLLFAMIIIVSEGIAQTAWAQNLKIIGLLNRMTFISLLIWIFFFSWRLIKTTKTEKR